jgi:hypothetical protein
MFLCYAITNFDDMFYVSLWVWPNWLYREYAWSNAKHKNGEVETEEQKQLRAN